MPSRNLLHRLLVGSLFLLLPLPAALTQPPETPTDGEVRERIRQLERKNDQSSRLEALEWFQEHARAKNAALAIPVLERVIRDDPASNVREQAVLALSRIAREQKIPCPLALVQAIFDTDVTVRQSAGALATLCTAFAPGTVELAFRAAWSDDDAVRACGLNLLALAAPRDEKALAVIETAKNDRSFQVRHNAHCFKFQANRKLDEFLAWLIRLQERDKSVLDPVPNDKMLREREECSRNLGILGSLTLLLEWSEKRPGDLAATLVQLLDHPSPVVRRGAVRLIGVTAVKSDQSPPKSGDELYFSKVLSYLFPESEAGPSKEGGQPKPRLEKSKVAPYLEKLKVRERLEKLSKNDPDEEVQGAALSALARLARLQDKP